MRSYPPVSPIGDSPDIGAGERSRAHGARKPCAWPGWRGWPRGVDGSRPRQPRQPQ